MKDPREDLQNEVVGIIKNTPLLHSCVISATGSGKSFIAMKLLQEMGYKRPLILVNSQSLRDRNWANEFKKFDLENYYTQNVTMNTYQTAYKWDDSNHDSSRYDIVIMDEVDFMADTGAYSCVMSFFSDNKVVGLTGFVAPAKLKWFADNMPIIYEIGSAQMQKAGQLNKVEYRFVQYELSTAKLKKVSYLKRGKKKTFYTSDNAAYIRADEKYQSVLEEKKSLRNDNALGKYVPHDYHELLKGVNERLQWAMTARNKVVYTNARGAELAREVVQAVKDNAPGEKIVVFSAYTTQSEAISPNVFNGSKKKAENAEVFRKFVGSEITELAVCGKINRGESIPFLKYGLLESYNGSETVANQRAGRLLRLPPDQKAIMYVFLPYFREKQPDGTYSLKETFMVNSGREMLKSIDTSLNSTVNKTFNNE
tara:strand:+ start:24 stop:1298 length:1275 start_codon:yes stop_codon:yes gene_type:complete